MGLTRPGQVAAGLPGDFVIGAAETRESADALVEKYQHHRMADRAFDLFVQGERQLVVSFRMRSTSQRRPGGLPARPAGRRRHR